jgi:hypothetical protein
MGCVAAFPGRKSRWFAEFPALALFVLVLGAALMAVGAGYLLLGFDIVMTERGAAMTIGGAVALSGGVVTLGLGFAVLRLTQILRALETGAGQASGAGASHAAVAAVAAGAGALATGAALAAAADSAPAGVDAAAIAVDGGVSPDPVKDAVDSILDDGVGSETPPEAPTPEPPLPEDPGESVAPSEPTGGQDDEEPEVAPDTVTEAQTERSEEGEASEDVAALPLQSEPSPMAEADVQTALASDEPPEPPAPTLPEQPILPAQPILPGQPTVLGNYRAGGRVYTMYSNGTVEAVTEHGVERFESMQALREHLART